MKFLVNGQEYELDIDPDTPVVDLLRQHLGLTGTKVGCGDGQCGACTVLVDRRPVRACVYPAHRAAGREILTIEGLAASAGSPNELHPLQKAFAQHGALECGFCTPGMLMSAASLWDKIVNPQEELPPITDDVLKHVLGRNACRCTGYAGVLRAFHSALHELETGEPLPPLHLDGVKETPFSGRPGPHPEVEAKLTGRAQFADDLDFPGMLYGATLRATYPHARILDIDTSQAEALAGVRVVLTHQNVPGENRHGPGGDDRPLLCADKVRYLGDAVALAAADSPQIAAQALEQIRVRYEPLPVISSPEQARRPDAPLIHPDEGAGNLVAQVQLQQGDLVQGWADAACIVERDYRTPMQAHFFIEPECSVVVPAGYPVWSTGPGDADHPTLTIYTGAQASAAGCNQIAQALGLPADQVRLVKVHAGSSFAGRQDLVGPTHAALLAQATGRPVKLLYDRAESMLANPKRPAMAVWIKTGARRDGILTAVEVELVVDSGAYADFSQEVLANAVGHVLGPYQVLHFQIDGRAYATNNPPAGAFHDLGVGPVALAVEQNLDILAEALAMDPFELRRRNLLRQNAAAAAGQALQPPAGLVECLDWVEKRVGELRSDEDERPERFRVAWGLAAGCLQVEPESIAHHVASAGALAAQVQVDTRNGRVKVLRIVAAVDSGRVAAAQVLLRQMEGGVVMGVGAALSEEYRLEDGIPQTRRWIDYKVPLVRQVPEMDLHVVENPDQVGAARATGEMPFVLVPPAVCNAIYRATGVRPLRLPVWSAGLWDRLSQIQTDRAKKEEKC